ncbi:ATP-binding cassette domain-containing protein [Marivita sp. S6314]|uniref:thiamine ABC transporter ATP-binding protein n=1 Tax=Marivita sp. S6314 TaxID=2926406 RepID=UPI001FF2BC95|nr:ATP-binding cassette domain-containing protein [Marivita sp. S6314]MCK0150037.1 ATP-binding cassette domain-containing protein [Marivita sp. S6314]
MALHLDHIHVQAGDFTLAADLRLHAGSRTAIIGASGSGKSTLLDVIAGFRAPTQGRVRWHDHDLTAQPPAKRPISILFQDTNLFPHLTIGENLALALNPRTGRVSAEERARIDDVLARVGLAGFAPRRMSDMSGGQQSRAALARVLVQDRPVLLLDEPFSALGPALKTEMLDLVMEIANASGMTVLLVTHDPAEARRFAPQIVVVEQGKAWPPTETGPLLDNPPTGLRAYLGS